MSNDENNGKFEGWTKRDVQNVEEKEKEILDAIFSKEPKAFEIARKGGVPHGRREACTRQVFATEAIAKSAARLIKAKVKAEPFRCEICGMIHLSEELIP